MLKSGAADIIMVCPAALREPCSTLIPVSLFIWSLHSSLVDHRAYIGKVTCLDVYTSMCILVHTWVCVCLCLCMSACVCVCLVSVSGQVQCRRSHCTVDKQTINPERSPSECRRSSLWREGQECCNAFS